MSLSSNDSGNDTSPGSGQSSDDEHAPRVDSGRGSAADAAITRMIGLAVESHAGPIPSPRVLEGYERIVPGSAKLIIRDAHKQSRHRRELELAVILGANRRSDRGLIIGALLAGSSIVLGFVAILLGHDVAGGLLATGSVVSLAGVFVTGTVSQRRERVEKEKIAEAIRSVSRGTEGGSKSPQHIDFG